MEVSRGVRGACSPRKIRRYEIASEDNFRPPFAYVLQFLAKGISTVATRIGCEVVIAITRNLVHVIATYGKLAPTPKSCSEIVS